MVSGLFFVSIDYSTMPPKDLNSKLAKLRAKKETFFNKIHRSYDLLRDLNNENDLNNLKI